MSSATFFLRINIGSLDDYSFRVSQALVPLAFCTKMATTPRLEWVAASAATSAATQNRRLRFSTSLWRTLMPTGPVAPKLRPLYVLVCNGRFAFGIKATTISYYYFQAARSRKQLQLLTKPKHTVLHFQLLSYN